MIARIIKIAGVVLFAAAFFLPAVRSVGTGPGSGPMVGWVCAFFAGAATAGIFHLDAAWQGKDVVGSVCLILSGWVNPLVLLYLVFSISRRFVLLRRILAVAILVCFAATWAFLAKAPMVPLVGHFLWVAGASMILAGEVTRRHPEKDNKQL